jgi:adenylate kinase
MAVPPFSRKNAVMTGQRHESAGPRVGAPHQPGGVIAAPGGGPAGRDKRVLLIGAPGAGKGTQATQIAQRFGLTHISSGDLLRKHVVEGTAIGRAVRGYVERGDLVPDGIIMDMLYKPVLAASRSGGYVLDGFPRTVEQAEAAYKVAGELGAGVQAAVHIDVPRDELVRRLFARGRGNEDTKEIIAHRIEVYEQRTVPMLDYYAERERVIRVNGARPVNEVTWSIVVQLQQVQTR